MTTKKGSWEKVFRSDRNQGITSGPGPKKLEKIMGLLAKVALHGSEESVPVCEFGTTYRTLPVRISGVEVLEGKILLIHGYTDYTLEDMTRSDLHGRKVRIHNYKPKERLADYMEWFTK